MIKRSKVVKDGKSFYFFEIFDESGLFIDDNVVVSFLTDELDMGDEESVVKVGFHIKPAGEKYDRKANFLLSYKGLKENPLTVKLATSFCLYFYSISEYSNYLLLHIMQRFITFHLAKKISNSIAPDDSNVLSQNILNALSICNNYSDTLLNILNNKMDECSIDGFFGGKICLN